jgi:hypothetical protein
MNATDILKYGQLNVLKTIEGFPQAAWETSGACGLWSVKEIIAHLTSYECVLVEVLAVSVDSKRATPYLDKLTAPSGQFNDAEVAMRKHRTVREVLDEFNDAHAHVMSLVAQIPVEALRQVGTIPWYGAGYALDDFIVYAYYGHKSEHGAQIAAFRERLR